MFKSTAENPARARLVVYFIRRSAPSNPITSAKGIVPPPSTPTLSSWRKTSPTTLNTCSNSAICPEPDFQAEEQQQDATNKKEKRETRSDAKCQATVRRSPTKLNFGNTTSDNFALEKSEKTTSAKHSAKHQKTRKDVSEDGERSALLTFAKKERFHPNPSLVTCKYFSANDTSVGQAHFKGKPPLRPFTRLGCFRAKTPRSRAPSSFSAGETQFDSDRCVTAKLKKDQQSISAITMTRRSYTFADFDKLNLRTKKRDKHTPFLKQTKEVQSKNNLRCVSFNKF